MRALSDKLKAKDIARFLYKRHVSTIIPPNI
jgi:hypothetical protein